VARATIKETLCMYTALLIRSSTDIYLR
jgi:hypothetical protein